MKKTNIKITTTSNEAILKFEADYFLTEHTSYEYDNIDEAQNSPLAQQLFHLPFVDRIFIAQNFIAIAKYNIVDWPDVQEEVAEQIKNYLNQGGVVVEESPKKGKIPVTIYAESTPNPEVIKFVSNKKLVIAAHEFKNSAEAKDAPVVQELFNFPFVREVFIAENYISVSKHETADWNDITQELREFLRSYLEQGKEILKAHAATLTPQSQAQDTIDFENLDATSKEIIAIIEEYVKPAVASDGGNIRFDSYNPDTRAVKVILQGACSGCPSSTLTLKNGIENMLKEMLQGKVETVEAVNG